MDSNAAKECIRVMEKYQKLTFDKWVKNTSSLPEVRERHHMTYQILEEIKKLVREDVELSERIRPDTKDANKDENKINYDHV
jgi:hypothetical protein